MLVLACGTGEMLWTSARDHQVTRTGIDISTVFIATAHAHAAELAMDGRVSLMHGDAPVFTRGLDRPFLLMGDPQTNHHSVPSWKSLWDHSSGWHADLTLNGASGENAYKDAVWLIPQIARQAGLPESFVTRAIGTIDPAAAVRAQQAYLSAFFDRFLRGQDSHLLDSRPPHYPQFTFVE